MMTRLKIPLKSVLPWALLICFEMGAQLALKKAALGPSAGSSVAEWLGALVANPWFALSVACDAAGFLNWMTIVGRHDLSFAVPVSALSYFTILLASVLIMKESVDLLQLVGLSIIGFGIALVATGESSDSARNATVGDGHTSSMLNP